MISVMEALELVMNQTMQFTNEMVKLSSAQGKRLMEPIIADHDFPPFDRAMMDGFAISFEKWQNGQRNFRCHLTQSAGEPPQDYGEEECIEIMTGAVVPAGFDCIIPVEQVTCFSQQQVQFDESRSVKFQQHIHFRGTDSKEGERLIDEGTYLRSHHIATLASNGYSNIWVQSQPAIAIVATGDELVEVNATPLAHQIRKSNVYAIEALLSAFSSNIQKFHLPDEPAVIESWIRSVSLTFDLLIFTGGVSKGKKDYLPGIWQTLGYEKIFHGISQKPGKPMYFGKKENQLLFGLPGNPLSSLFCARRYITPFLQSQLNILLPAPTIELLTPLENKTSLTQWIPVQFLNEHWITVSFNGSGDVNGIEACVGFIEIPPHTIHTRFPLFELP